MFGYIQPDKSELRLREFAEYRAYYCGLCKCIGSAYGETARITLSYDCAFVALMLCGMAGSDDVSHCRCAYKPLTKPRLAAKENDGIRFAADLNILLSCAKLEDDWRDEKKLTSFAGRAAMKAAFESAKARAPRLHAAISDGIAELSALEKVGCADIDAPADAFARMMREIAACAPVEEEGNATAFRHLMYHLGRWVYLIDAWDDRDKDKRAGVYNPFLASGANRERAEFLLNCSLNEAMAAYELMDIRAHESLIDNFLRYGCRDKNLEVLGGKDEQSV